MEKRIDQLLKTLTLEEKIGQMTELTLGVLDGPYDPASVSEPDFGVCDMIKRILL